MPRLIAKKRCKHCRCLFRADPRNATRHRFCSKPQCRQASKAHSQNKWLAKDENKDYFRGPDHVRWVHAVVLSHYWRFEHPEMFDGTTGKYRGTIQWFFFGCQNSGAQVVYDWLCKEPKRLYEEINRIFADTMKKELGILDWTWTRELVAPPDRQTPDIWEGRLGLAQSELYSEYNAYDKLQKEKPRFYNYAERQKKRLKERQLLGFLASRNVLPKYGFPVDVVTLKIESKDEWAQRVELDRDLKIALGEYAPGCTLVANGRVIRSYALEIVRGKEWPQYAFRVCAECGKFHRSNTIEDPVNAKCDCGASLEADGNVELSGKFIEPIFGFRTNLNEDGQEPVEIRPQRTFPSRVFFSHYQVAPHDPFVPEGNPDSRAGIQIEKRYSRYGVLTVINTGRQDRGFWICPSCGYGDAVVAGNPNRHKTPWGTECRSRVQGAFLGHEFQSDVLEIRFSGRLAQISAQGFWLSLTAALLAGAAQALDIERDDIDGTVLRYGGHDYRAIVLFDSVPGGAGHVRHIASSLKKVFEAALHISDTCSDCSRDQACNSCLRNYRNQYAHDLLKRGPVADFLRKVLGGLYETNGDGFIPLGVADPWQWIKQQMRRAKRLDMVIEDLPVLDRSDHKVQEFYQVLHDVCLKDIPVRLLVRYNIDASRSATSGFKVSLHQLMTLTQSPKVDVFLSEKDFAISPLLYIETDTDPLIVRSPKGVNLFEDPKELEISSFESCAEKVRQSFDDAVFRHEKDRWDLERYEQFLQDTRVIHIGEGDRRPWKDILAPYLPHDIIEVKVYDRFLRIPYQVESLAMFIEAVAAHASKEGATVLVTTTSAYPKETRRLFKELQEKSATMNLKLKYEILEPDKKLPHYRRILIESKKRAISIWLDRGLDIYRFRDLERRSFTTLETYFVIENLERR